MTTEIVPVIRSLLSSQKEAMEISFLQNLYNEMMGEDIPYRKFGHRSLEEMLLSHPDDFVIIRDEYNRVLVKFIVKENMKHIAQMVGKQRDPKYRDLGTNYISSSCVRPNHSLYQRTNLNAYNRRSSAHGTGRSPPRRSRFSPNPIEDFKKRVYVNYKAAQPSIKPLQFVPTVISGTPRKCIDTQPNSTTSFQISTSTVQKMPEIKDAREIITRLRQPNTEKLSPSATNTPESSKVSSKFVDSLKSFDKTGSFITAGTETTKPIENIVDSQKQLNNVPQATNKDTKSTSDSTLSVNTSRKAEWEKYSMELLKPSASQNFYVSHQKIVINPEMPKVEVKSETLKTAPKAVVELPKIVYDLRKSKQKKNYAENLKTTITRTTVSKPKKIKMGQFFDINSVKDLCQEVKVVVKKTYVSTSKPPNAGKILKRRHSMTEFELKQTSAGSKYFEDSGVPRAQNITVPSPPQIHASDLDSIDKTPAKRRYSVASVPQIPETDANGYEATKAVAKPNKIWTDCISSNSSVTPSSKYSNLKKWVSSSDLKQVPTPVPAPDYQTIMNLQKSMYGRIDWDNPKHFERRSNVSTSEVDYKKELDEYLESKKCTKLKRKLFFWKTPLPLFLNESMMPRTPCKMVSNFRQSTPILDRSVVEIPSFCHESPVRANESSVNDRMTYASYLKAKANATTDKNTDTVDMASNQHDNSIYKNPLFMQWENMKNTYLGHKIATGKYKPRAANHTIPVYKRRKFPRVGKKITHSVLAPSISKPLATIPEISPKKLDINGNQIRNFMKTYIDEIATKKELPKIDTKLCKYRIPKTTSNLEASVSSLSNDSLATSNSHWKRRMSTDSVDSNWSTFSKSSKSNVSSRKSTNKKRKETPKKPKALAVKRGRGRPRKNAASISSMNKEDEEEISKGSIVLEESKHLTMVQNKLHILNHENDISIKVKFSI